MSAGRVLVAGSGKMARNLGFLLMRRGWTVTWASRDAVRLAELARWVSRRARSMDAEAAPPGFVLAGQDRAPEVDILLESTREDASAKTEMIESLLVSSSHSPVLLSNSSSILPREIHPRCAGLHFFYPVETTGIAELVTPERASEGAREAVRRLAESCEVELVPETESSAFAINRLLLSLQAEACRALMNGCGASAVDAATRSDLLASGTLASMDSIGLDVVLPAARNYLSRMRDDESAAYAPVVDCLGSMVRCGKLGTKNKNGFLMGQSLPWNPSQAPAPPAMVFLDAFLNACATAIEAGQLEARVIDLVLASLHGSNKTLEQAICETGAAGLGRRLGDRYRETGLCYFRPAVGAGAGG